MNILQKVFRREQVAKSETLEDRWIRERFADSDGPSDRTPEMTADTRGTLGYGGHSWTYVCINRIITMGSTAPYAALTNGEPAKQSPLLDLLAKPNPLQDGVDLFACTLLFQELWGNAYWVIERDGRGKPMELWPIPGNRMKPTNLQNGVPTAFELSTETGRPITYAAEDVAWFHYEGPGSTVDSVAPTDAASQAIKTDIYALRANLAYFERGANPRWALKKTTPGDLTDSQRSSLRAQFQSLYQGVGKWFRPLVLSDGLEMQQLDDKPDGSWLEMRTQLRQEILAVYGVPPALCFLFDNAQFGVSIREQRAMMWDVCLCPRLSGIAASINRKLTPQVDPRIEFAWLFKQIPALMPNWAEMAQAAVQLTGLLSRDEIRETLFGMPAWGGEWGTGAWGPLSTVQLADAQGRPVMAPEPPPMQEPAPQEAPPKGKAWRRLSDNARKALWKQFNQNRTRETAQVKRVVGKWYGERETEVLANLGAAKAAGNISRVKAPSLDAILFSERNGTASLQEAMQRVLSTILADTGQEAVAQVGAELRFDVDSPRARSLLKSRVQEMKTVVGTAQDTLRASIAEGLQAGETVEQLTARVMEWSATGKRHHAENVARTETGVVMNTAALEGYRQAGADGKEWLSIVDDRSRAEHADMDGTVVGIDESFDLDGVECDGPGDPALGPEDVCNCRCTIAPVVGT